MKEIHLKHKDDTDFSMRFAEETDYDQCFDEDVKVYKPDGSILAILLKNSLSQVSVAKAWYALEKYNQKTFNRSVASGIEKKPREKKDGSPSSTKTVPKGWGSISGTIGSFERTIRMPYAHYCAWNLKRPDLYRDLLHMANEVSRLFEIHVPDRFANQKAFCERTHPAWIIPGTVYTTITVNKNFRTACHLDAGDLENGFSALAVIRQGKFNGANLVFPGFRVAVKLDTYDLFLFDPHEYHGNTQLIPMSSDSVRCSLVFYFREKLALCRSPEEELVLAQRRKPGDPLFGEKK